MSDTEQTPMVSFSDLGLSEPILKAVNQAGYETPSPIQAQSITPLLEGRDLLGQAQTGTGKTIGKLYADLYTKDIKIIYLIVFRMMSVLLFDLELSYSD